MLSVSGPGHKRDLSPQSDPCRRVHQAADRECSGPNPGREREQRSVAAVAVADHRRDAEPELGLADLQGHAP